MYIYATIINEGVPRPCTVQSLNSLLFRLFKSHPLWVTLFVTVLLLKVVFAYKSVL